MIGADRQRSGLSCVLLKRVPQGRTVSGGIVLAANAGLRVPSGGVTLNRRCTYRPSVIYLIVNQQLSTSLSLSLSLSLSASLSVSLSQRPVFTEVEYPLLRACSSSTALIAVGLHTHVRTHRTSSDPTYL